MSTSLVFIPIRNLSGFDKILRIEGAGDDYLLIPRGLFPSGPFGRADWINRTHAYFYGLDSYLLMTACDSANEVPVKNRLLSQANEIIYEVMKLFPDSSLAPHALSEDEMVPKDNEIQQDAVEIHPSLFRRDYDSDPFIQALYQSIHPHQQVSTILHLINRQRSSGSFFGTKDIVEEVNRGRAIEREKTAHGIAGSIVCERLSDFTDKSAFRWPKVLSALSPAALRHSLLPMLGHLYDFWGAFNGWGNKPKRRWGRYFWEYGDFGALRPPLVSITESQSPNLGGQAVFEIKKKYILERDVEKFKANIHNFYWAHLNSTQTAKDKCWHDLMQTYPQFGFGQIRVSLSGYNQELLSYFLEAYGASRPGIKFLHLYNVFEARMISPGPDKTQLMRFLNSLPLATNDFDPEFSAALSYVPPTTVSGIASGLSQMTNTLASMVDELYAVRCMVAHSKAGRNRIAPFSVEEYSIVPNYLELMKKVAMVAIER